MQRRRRDHENHSRRAAARLFELSLAGIRNTLEEARKLIEKTPETLLQLGQAVSEVDAAAAFHVGEVRGQVYVVMGALSMTTDDLKEVASHVKGECECQTPEPLSKGGDA